MERRRGKNLWKSKTLWFNIACAAIAAAEGAFGVFQGVLQGNVYAALSVILAVGNAMLRVVTTERIGR